MLKVSGRLPCSDVQVAEDPYLPLKVTWDVSTPGGVLYAFFEGGDGGYVELKFSRENFALYQLVVVDSPPEKSIEHYPVDVPIQIESSPCVSPSTWKWRTTPDYQEVEDEAVDRICGPLSVMKSSSMYILRFSDDWPVERMASGAAAVGVSAEGTICDVSINTSGEHWHR